ncbi:hypothetical protein GOD71_30580 [Sinorhizobium medicae]|nr:hypothetical protein [Sinorhizobium medicae]MDX0506477.1 hypothetical protein [Sinorhizobium medicae]MDX0592902.1 hypothetical protein [Sinorhizobium medicae]MDX0648944.1 hypothetical protein [Sinorhizobium medicae]MDX0741785.1 hypothetical protein [Sinorhizobium medicae]
MTAAHATDAGEPISLCADFSFIPDDTQFPQDFDLGVFHFHSNSPRHWFANATLGEVGLQFFDQGAEIGVLTSVPEVKMRIGTFNGETHITALNSAGATVANLTVPGTNSYQDLTVQGTDIVKLSLKGGGHEGILVRACVEVAINGSTSIPK